MQVLAVDVKDALCRWVLRCSESRIRRENRRALLDKSKYPLRQVYTQRSAWGDATCWQAAVGVGQCVKSIIDRRSDHRLTDKSPLIAECQYSLHGGRIERAGCLT